MLCLVSVLLCKEECSSHVSLQLLRGVIWVSLSMSFLGLGIGTMLANFHMCGIMLVLTAVFNMLVRNASPRGPMYIFTVIHVYGTNNLHIIIVI